MLLLELSEALLQLNCLALAFQRLFELALHALRQTNIHLSHLPECIMQDHVQQVQGLTRLSIDLLCQEALQSYVLDEADNSTCFQTLT